MGPLIRIIVGSIIGVVLGIWYSRKVKLVPRRMKRKYSFFMQAIYTFVLTATLCLLSLAGLSLSFSILIGLSLLTWIFAGWLLNSIARRKGEELQRTDQA
jgi:phosphatidylglycerophosphate synthase